MTAEATTETSVITDQGADDNTDAGKADGGGADTKATDSAASSSGSVLDEGEGDSNDKGDGQGSSDESAKDKGSDTETELEVTLPEGVTVDEEVLAGFKTFATEQKFTSEQASAAAAHYAELNKQATEQQEQTLATQNKEWVDGMQKDPVLVGEDGKGWDASMAAAKRGLAHIGASADELKTYGLGNFPTVVKLAAALGKAIGEDTTSADTERGGPGGELTHEQRLARRYKNSQ